MKYYTVKRAERHFAACTSEATLRVAIKKWGVRWLISQYHTAIVNWNLCLDEVVDLRAENAKLRGRGKK